MQYTNEVFKSMDQEIFASIDSEIFGHKKFTDSGKIFKAIQNSKEYKSLSRIITEEKEKGFP